MLKNELLGMELDIIELDNKMVELGFYSVLSDEILDDIIRDKNVYYLSTIDNETSILIEFDIIILANKDIEYLAATLIKIKNIYN